MKYKATSKEIKLLVDSSHILYVVYFGLGADDRTVQEITQGFLKRILQLLKEQPTDDIVFCWDSPISIRKERYPFYKDKRGKAKKNDPNIKNIHKASTELKTVLLAMGFKSHVEVEGYENDDTMCELVRRYPNTDFIIVANDHDLFQILKYRNLRGLFDCRENKLTTRHDFTAKYNLPPEDWALFKAIGGCASDEVPGIPGLGNTYTTKFLNGEDVPERIMESIDEHKHTTFIRNMWLVALPLAGLNMDIIMLPNKLTRKKLKLVSDVYGIYFSDEWYSFTDRK